MLSGSAGEVEGGQRCLEGVEGCTKDLYTPSIRQQNELTGSLTPSIAATPPCNCTSSLKLSSPSGLTS
jgi:hypothetical protein